MFSYSVFADDNISATLVPKAQQLEIKSAVFANVLKSVKKCNNAELTNISVTSTQSGLMKNKDGKVIFGEWQEEWTINACGADVVVPISFKQNLSEYSARKNIIHSNCYLKYKFAPLIFK